MPQTPGRARLLITLCTVVFIELQIRQKIEVALVVFAFCPQKWFVYLAIIIVI